ncbi:MAG: isoprenylcysteine carboxylmethyltransferase family protein [Lentisphaeria bacterium]|nr:isoprenylcysteine carboxylmethyltransferase family protein [Lentisphaeria bacterium]
MSEHVPMGRWGIGPQFGSVMILYAILAEALTIWKPNLFGALRGPGRSFQVVGVLLLVAGVCMYVWSLAILKPALRERRVASTGPFACVQHPLYASWILLLVPGTALLCHSWLVLTASGVGYVFFRLLISREEMALLAAHGEAYREYASTRGRLVPRMGTCFCKRPK